MMGVGKKKVVEMQDRLNAILQLLKNAQMPLCAVQIQWALVCTQDKIIRALQFLIAQGTIKIVQSHYYWYSMDKTYDKCSNPSKPKPHDPKPSKLNVDSLHYAKGIETKDIEWMLYWRQHNKLKRISDSKK